MSSTRIRTLQNGGWDVGYGAEIRRPMSHQIHRSELGTSMLYLAGLCSVLRDTQNKGLAGSLYRLTSTTLRVVDA